MARQGLVVGEVVHLHLETTQSRKVDVRDVQDAHRVYRTEA